MKGIRRLLLIAAAIVCCLLCARPVRAAGEEYLPLTIRWNNMQLGAGAYRYRGTPYIPLSVLKAYGDCSALEFDEKNAKVFFDVSSMNILIADDETTAFIRANADTCYLYLRRIDGELYAPVDTLGQFTGISYECGETVLSLAPRESAQKMAHIAEGGAQGASSLFDGSGRTVQLASGQPVEILSGTTSAFRVRTMFGEAVYVDRALVDPEPVEVSLPLFSYEKRTPKTYDGKINLVWHNIGTSTQKVPAPTGGIDILSPVYFRLQNGGKGDVWNYASLGYTNNAHAAGFDVWATINNDMTAAGSTASTHNILSDDAMRDRSAAKFLFYAALYGVDGINVDYETVKDEDREGFTAFVATLSEYTHRMGIHLAVSLPPVRSWYQEYDYAALGSLCDYITLMSYDEHYSGSASAGSVSSRVWYEAAVRTLTGYAPARKILLGIPFYTRIWTQNSARRLVGNSAVRMGIARERVAEAGVVPVWNDTAGQFYAEYPSGSNTVRIWLEDKRSIAVRLSAVYAFDLAGSCCWELGQAEEGVFDLFEQVYKNGVDPASYDGPY